MYYVKNQKYDDLSAKNQKIISLFLHREQVRNVTPWVNYVFSTMDEDCDPPFCLDDVSPRAERTICPECGHLGFHQFVVTEADVLETAAIQDQAGLWKCPLCEETWETQEDALQCCIGTVAWQCNDCEWIVSPDEIEHKRDTDICDTRGWYFVSEFLGKQLMEYGELIFKTGTNDWIWGRTAEEDECPLSQDASILSICRELGILEGQSHAWPVR